MEIAWGRLWQASRERLKASWLITSALIAICMGAVEPMNRYREITNQRETGIGAVAQLEPVSPWAHSGSVQLMLQKDVTRDGGRDSLNYLSMAAPYGGGGAGASSTSEDRKTIHIGTMDLIVKSPRQMLERIHELIESAGGYSVNSAINGAQDSASASMQIRVPVAKFEGVRAAIRKLGCAWRARS
jgi:hypothetical protein